MIPTRIGQRVPGGHFAGINRISNSVYAVVVSLRLSETTLPCKIENSFTPNTQTVNDGLSNTLAMDSNEHPAAQYCLGLEVNKCKDFYLPSMCELELCYRNLKPGNSENFIRAGGKLSKPLQYANGTNLFSIPTGKPYTITDPAQTIVMEFVTSNAGAFDFDDLYWASTEYSSQPRWTVFQVFESGEQGAQLKFFNTRVRAVRRIRIA